MITTNHLLRSGCNSLNPSGLRSLHFFFSSHLFLSKSVVCVCQLRNNKHRVLTPVKIQAFTAHIADAHPYVLNGL